MIGAAHYILLGVLGFVGTIWALSSMGIIQTRDHELYAMKQRHIEQAVRNIELVYNYLESLPEPARAKIIEHLDNGMINHALEAARTHHDVYHFFKSFG